MTYCPRCGTANKPSSKFCKDCGALLAPTAERRCPLCGTPNPPRSSTCVTCGGRLGDDAPSAAQLESPETIAPFSPPEIWNDKPAFHQPYSAMPPASPAEKHGSQASASTSQDTTATPADSDLPDWLKSFEATDAPSSQGLTRLTPQHDDSSPAPVETSPTRPATEAKRDSELRLTGDDYDYADVPGQVTEEMKARLAAEAHTLQSVDDQVALARRLLGLEPTEPSADVPVAPAAAPPQGVAEVVPPQGIAKVVLPQGVSEAAPPQGISEVIPPQGVTEVVPPQGAAEVAPPQGVSEAAPPQGVAEVASPQGISEVMPSQGVAEAAPPQGVTEVVPPQGVAEVASPQGVSEAAPPRQDVSEAVSFQDISTFEIVGDETAAERPGEPVSLRSQRDELELGELPEWLKQFAPSQADWNLAGEEAGRAGKLPDWMRDISSALPVLDAQEQEQLPDWLREPIELPDTATVAPPAQVEIPKAAVPFERQEAAASFVETTGPLAGISDILPLALAINEPHTPSISTPLRGNGGPIFQAVMQAPLAPAVTPRAHAEQRGILTRHHLIYLLILLAALVPLFLPFELAGLGLDVSHTPTAIFFDHLQSVPRGGVALMAFDYPPGLTVELDPAARAIAGELARREINVIALSTTLNGASIGQAVLGDTAKLYPNFKFVNLGYLPGGEAGLRSLAGGWLARNHLDVNGNAWGASPLAERVRGMDDLDLTIVLSGEEAGLRAWMEQVQPRVKSPLIAATTAALDPQARNYVNAGQLRASLRGLTGAAELELLSNRAGRAVKTVDVLSWVSLVLAALIIVANVAALLGKRKSDHE